MTKYRLYFTTEIRGSVVVEADSQEAADEIGEEMAMNTVNYDEMERHGVPNVDTEFTDITPEKV